MTQKLIVFLMLTCYPLSMLIAQQDLKLEQYIDSLFKKLGNKTPGIAITVLQNGKPIAQKKYGMANLENDIPFSENTPVRRTYSGTREFMFSALMLMEDQGLLKISDRVRKYIPLLPAWSEPVTILDLINHSSGFEDEWATLGLTQSDMANNVTSEEFLKFMYRQPAPQFEAGKGYMYNNSDMALLRMIMEKVSAQPLPDYLQKNLFGPLVMTSTFMNDNMSQVIPGLAQDYYPVSANTYEKNYQAKVSPGGNYRIVTTQADLVKWAKAVEDSSSIAAKAIARLLKISRPIPVFFKGKHFPFGHEIQEGGKLIKHGGVNEDYYITRIPSKRITIIALGNQYRILKRAESIAEYFLAPSSEADKEKIALPEKVIPMPKAEMEKLAGLYSDGNVKTYSSAVPDLVFWEFKVERDSLRLYYQYTAFATILKVGEGFYMDKDGDAWFKFEKSPEEDNMIIKAYYPDGTSFRTLVKSKLNSTLSREFLEPFAGLYHSPSLDYFFRIVLNEKNELILQRPTFPDLPVKVLSEKVLILPDMGQPRDVYKATVTFNKDGKVNGFNVQESRLMNHRFNKVEMKNVGD